MAITSEDGIVAALATGASRIVIDKASISNMLAGNYASLWRATGVPGQGAIPTTAAVCTSALAGSMSFANQTLPASSYIGWLWAVTGNAATNVEIHDRLAHMGGLSGTVTTAQGALNLTGVSSDRTGATNYSDIQWWLEWYTDTGSTSVNATVAVVYDDDSTGNLTAITLGATARASRLFPLIPAVSGRYIKSITSVTLSATTGTAGNFGITATRPRVSISTAIANKSEVFDWAQLGLANVPNDACLAMIMVCTATTTGTVRGGGKIIHG